MSNIYLIRHAQQVEDFVPEGQQQGPPLAPVGITQAEHLRDRLAATHEIQADVLISSPLLRARTTAEILAPALGLPVMVDEDFQEFRLGNRAGITDKDMGEVFGLVDFEREPLTAVAPGGESWQQFNTRISSAFDRITRDYDGKTVVIITHDGVICASFLYFLGLPSLKFAKGLFRPAFGQFYTNTTSITNWYKSLFSDLQPQEPVWTLVRYNDDVHLYDIGSETRINWSAISPTFVGGPGKRPVRISAR